MPVGPQGQVHLDVSSTSSDTDSEDEEIDRFGRRSDDQSVCVCERVNVCVCVRVRACLNVCERVCARV